MGHEYCSIAKNKTPKEVTIFYPRIKKELD